jgi:cyclic beta-1,2-glucan synthetase
LPRRLPFSDGEEAIRAELFSIERLEAHAQSLAIAQPVSDDAPRRKPLPTRLKENASRLRAAFDAIVKSAQRKKTVTPAGEWLLDNFHVVEEQVREIRRHLPPDYYRQLPKLADGPLEGYPRIYGIAWAIIAHTDSAFTLEHLVRFVNSYQKVEPLTIGELWAIGVTLRIALVENLRRLAESTIRRNAAAERAEEVANSILASDKSKETLAGILGRLNHERLSAAFIVRLEERLRDLTETSAEILAWLDKRVAATGIAMEQLAREEYDRQSAANVSVRNVISSMRLVSTTDWADFVESVSLVDRLLNRHDDFNALDFATRNIYRQSIERLARGAKRSEIDVTKAAIREAEAAAKSGRPAREQNIGFYLVSDGIGTLENAIGYRFTTGEGIWRAAASAPLPLYIGSIAVISTILLVLVLDAISHGESRITLVPFILGFLPATQIAVAIVNRIATGRFGPTALPGLKLAEGIPAQLRTAVAVPILLTSKEAIDGQIKQLEVHYLANLEDNLTFILLSDWTDADAETMPADQLLLARARDGIAALNHEYPTRKPTQRFLLLHRRRIWNQAQGKWMGWERKRGKLHELNRLLRGHSDTTFIDGEEALTRVPRDVRYIITLDADTRLPRGAACKLIGKMAHPLNRPELDEKQHCVVAGHGILQPRVTPSLPASSEGSLFQWTFSGAIGLDPYAFAISDVYQDMFREGSYVGKGIYDIDAFEAALSNRIPENTILSHDLLEGSFARAALISDVEVVEEFPSRYDVEAARQHRWIRGDWQLLPWIFSPWCGLSALGRWKMLDNLRRSLSAPATLLAFLWGWTLPFADALWWTGFVLASIALPPLLPVLDAFSPHRIKQILRNGFSAVSRDASLAGLHIMFVTAFMARHAWLALDAIARTLFRLIVSRRYMLQWVTFAQTAYSRRGGIDSLAFQMAGAAGFALAVIAITAAFSPRNLYFAAPFIGLWAFSPLLARGASETPPAEQQNGLSESETEGLRLVARRTWRFFETFVTPEDNMLPPDNFQETPKPVVAHRTSPTNIGLYLLVVISARDFGWTGIADCLDRIEASFASMDKLERYRGHFLNWYETQSLQSLYPRYVSSVDSGNLAAHLIVLKNSCLSFIDQTVQEWKWRDGLRDALTLLRDACAGDEALLAETDHFASLLEKPVSAFADLLNAFELLQSETDAILRAVKQHAEDPEHSSGITVWAEALAKGVQSCRRDLAAFSKNIAPHTPLSDIRIGQAAPALAARLRKAASAAEDIVLRMDFKFLYNGQNKLLFIGYRVEDQEPDSNSYDLLASEARLASLLAIAKGDVPTTHWFHLGRTLVAFGRSAALQSWSGSMFEYLMPSLVLREPSGSLLAQSNRLAVKAQIAYGRRRHVPWGISESQYNGRDLEQNYQYTGFGVPDLGLKRGLDENLVIAPYASGLAAMVEPAEALRNYERLTGLGARGFYGWYEAIDYTRSRLAADQRYAIVRSYMAHHQAMSILGISNALLGAPLRQRFHTDAMIEATELLLQERTARDVYLARPPRRFLAGTVAMADQAPGVEWRIKTAYTAIPRTHLLSNSRYSVMLTTAGSGYSRWGDIQVTRWREDTTRDQWGSYIFLRDLRSDLVWSAGYQPCATPPDDYEAVLTEDRACITRNDFGITTKLEVLISPEDDAEVRRVSITNNGNKSREIDITSYAELVLAPERDDAAHPAFSKMFVETEYVRNLGALLAKRKPRKDSSEEVWAAHLAVAENIETASDIQFETDRARFLGRNRLLRLPATFADSWPLSNTTGAVLDPIFSIRRAVKIPRGQTVHVSFWTMIAPTREEIMALADKHHDAAAYMRAATLAATHARSQLQHLGIGPEEAYQYQLLANHLMYVNGLMRAPPDVLQRGAGPASQLWPLSISGDLPILLLRIDSVANVEIVRQILKAHEYWRTKNLAVDVVVLNESAASYTQDLQTTLDMLVRTSGDRSMTAGGGKTGRVYLVRRDVSHPELEEFLMASARVVLFARRGSLFDQIKSVLKEKPAAKPAPVSKHPAPLLVTDQTRSALEHFNGLGGFTEGAKEYVVVLAPGKNTPAPWINVIANSEFGFQASAEGAGFTWSVNSQQNQITSWSNDPVANETSEAFYIRDLESGEVWCPTAQPVRDPNGTYIARHGQGYSVFEYTARGISTELVQFVPLDMGVKISRLRLRNISRRPRRLAVYAYAEWKLGNAREISAPHIVTEKDDATGAILAGNRWNNDYGHRVAFFDMGGRQEQWTCDRAEFLGRNGNLEAPAALAEGETLSGMTGAGADPCTALQTPVTFGANEDRDIAIFLGQSESRDAALEAIRKCRELNLDAELQKVRAFWDQLLTCVEVRTPDKAMNVMLNRWLLYQTLSCRLWARAGFYQASGAYGFRDQLQDVMALCIAKPEMAREHLLRAASRQFVEGDVQHWWLSESGQGIRTRISDDKTWLAYVALHYLDVTQDHAVLDETVGFLDGPVLAPGQVDSFFQPQQSSQSATLYEHCARALDHSLAVGSHGLPLMGSGDWNDGMNRVGEHGKGESIWLGWFLYDTLSRFAAVAETRGDAPRAANWIVQAAALKDSLEAHGWDGDWYLRAYFDDGSPLGSASNRECRIDSIAQSWSVISGGASPERAARAMEAVERYLVRPNEGLITLFTPPFALTARDPGYIKGYPAGIRENGGQYTHAALWTVLAFAMLGKGDKAGELYAMLNPINQARSSASVQRYRVEPYVTTGDVYSVAPHVGRGGWTWYSGSAGWMYRVGIESILGLQLKGDALSVDPCIPSHWPGFDATIRKGNATYRIAVENPQRLNRGVAKIYFGGREVSNIAVPLLLNRESGEFQIRIVMGTSAAAPAREAVFQERTR